MKQGQIIKSAAQALKPEELAQIHTYTRREMAQEEIYTFSVVLCDNDIDRDFECFDEEALYTLKRLFVGKTGIFDHDLKAENQTARIYDCYVERLQDKKTQTGKPYMRLVGKAYLPRCAKNEDLILALDSGIQKEVSVGCAISRRTCSVCGEDMGACAHQKGKKYRGRLCYATLSGITDAYEWSFVAVPAQRQAGVLKALKKEDMEGNTLQNIIKSLCAQQPVMLSAQDAQALYAHIRGLECDAGYGSAYRQELKDEVVRLGMLVQPEIAKETMQSLTEKMDIEELKAFKKGYMEKGAKVLPLRPQLFGPRESGKKTEENTDYKI